MGHVHYTSAWRCAGHTGCSRHVCWMNEWLVSLRKVGYTVRFDDVTSDDTKIKFLTDGMLLREAILDSLLRKYSCIILDEAHERTIHTDVLFGVVKAAQKRRKELGKLPLKVGAAVLPRDLGQRCWGVRGRAVWPPKQPSGLGRTQKGWPEPFSHPPCPSRRQVIVMSATMDVDLFSQYFNGAPVLYLEGRQHPIQIFYTKQPQHDYLHAALVSVFQIHQVGSREWIPGKACLALNSQP